MCINVFWPYNKLGRVRLYIYKIHFFRSDLGVSVGAGRVCVGDVLGVLRVICKLKGENSTPSQMIVVNEVLKPYGR